IAVPVPGAQKSAVGSGDCIIKTRALAVWKYAEQLSRFAFVTRDGPALHHIHGAFPVRGERPERHLRIDRPLRNELSRRVKNLDAAAEVLAHVDVALAVRRDRAGILHHAGADAFAAELEHL